MLVNESRATAQPSRTAFFFMLTQPLKDYSNERQFRTHKTATLGSYQLW